MKTLIKLALMLASVACGAAALAQIQANPANSQSPNSVATPQEAPMSKAQRIQQLKPATNYVELMQLLRIIHQHGLLVDLTFMDDANILRLFGEGEIEETKSQMTRLYWKRFIASKDNPLQIPIDISGVSEAPGFGGIYIRFQDWKPLPIDLDLIETHLLPGVQGWDPSDPTRGMTNEAKEALVTRPRPTHPKGYWSYFDRYKAPDYTADVYVTTGRNAEVLDIRLSQDQY